MSAATAPVVHASHMEAGSAEAKDLIDTLVRNRVAITSTLPVFERDSGLGRPPLRQQVLDVMTPQARQDFLYLRERPAPKEDAVAPFKRNMELERAFVAAGGLLIAGPDPTGAGDVIPGFGDQREIELLVEAGFSPVEAIRIATLNGATYLGRQDQIGSIAAGKNADMVVMKGDPSKQIADVENVEIVFKDGVGYDSHKLLESVRADTGNIRCRTHSHFTSSSRLFSACARRSGGRHSEAGGHGGQPAQRRTRESSGRIGAFREFSLCPRH